MIARWTGPGPCYGLLWGGYQWSLAVDGDKPGLTTDVPGIGTRLSLAGISAPGRDDPSALSGDCLLSHECRWNRVEALYAPEGWHSLRVRATWTPGLDGILDLEVQLQADSVDELQAIQAHVSGPAPINFSLQSGPLITTVDDSQTYFEMSHPDDTFGRVFQSGSVRYGLFGYDLERGVILRARLRGIWLEHRPDEVESTRLQQEFLQEPLPLGT